MLHASLALAVVLGACGGTHAVEPPAPVAAGAACPGATMLPVPAALEQRGPWAVGVRTVRVENLTVEVWYPALPGSERGRPTERYDLRTAMPPAEAAKIPDADNAWLPCACVRDLPLDEAHGPYPAVLFLHGAASVRAQSAFLMTHWASRGFIVVAPDLPGVGLAAALGGQVGFPAGAPIAMIDALTQRPEGDDPLAFIRPHLAAHVAIAGHSLGAILEGTVGERPEISVQITMAGLATTSTERSTLALYGDHDGIASAPSAADAAAASVGTNRVGVIRGAGHLAFTDLCGLAADRGGALAVARAHGVALPEMIATLATDGCRPTDAPFATTAPAIRALTAGVLEERLHCDPAATRALAALRGDPRIAWSDRTDHR